MRKALTVLAVTLLIIFCPAVGSSEQPELNGQIVFSRNVDGNWDIWSFDVRTRRATQMTQSPEDESNPVWLENGRSIAFLRNGDIFVLRKGRESRMTTEGTYRFLTYDSIHNRLLFSKYVAAEDADLGALDLSTGEERIILTRPGQQVHASVSENGEVVYFAEGRLVQGRVVQDINCLQLDTGLVTRLIGGDGSMYYRPDPGPDGKLVCVNCRPGVTCLYLMDLQTKMTTQLAPREGSCDFPKWSQDGTRILYVKLHGSRTQICIITLKTGSIDAIDLSGDSKEPDW